MNEKLSCFVYYRKTIEIKIGIKYINIRPNIFQVFLPEYMKSTPKVIPVSGVENTPTASLAEK